MTLSSNFRHRGTVADAPKPLASFAIVVRATAAEWRRSEDVELFFCFSLIHYKDYVMGDEDGIPKTPKWAESICGVDEVTITRLARQYATVKPAALIDSHGPPRSAMGEQFTRGAFTLCTMTGNIVTYMGSHLK